MTQKILFEELNNALSGAITAADPENLRHLLKDSRYEELKGSKWYVPQRQLRGKAFLLLGDFKKADQEIHSAFSASSGQESWNVGIEWVRDILQKLPFVKGEEEKDGLFNQIDELTEELRKLLQPKDPGFSFKKLTLASLRAFCHIYFEDGESARKEFKGCRFLPVPIKDYNDKEQLVYFFSHVFKGLLVALELQDSQLLRAFLQVLSVDDQVLYGEKNLLKVFQITLNDSFGMRPEFAGDFNFFFKHNLHLTPSFPKVREFFMFVMSGNNQGLEKFFQAF